MIRSPGASTGMPGGYGATTSAHTRPGRLVPGHRLPRGEERVARGEHLLGLDGPGGVGHHRAGRRRGGRSTITATRLGEVGDRRVVVGQRHHRHQEVAVGHLHAKPPPPGRGRPRSRRLRSRAGARPAWRRRTIGPERRRVGRDQAGHPAQDVARTAYSVEQGARQLDPADRHQRQGAVDARQDRARRRGRGSRVHGSVETVGVRSPPPPGAGEHDGTLVQRGQGLVGAGDDGVRAGRERVRRQVGMAAQVRTPRRVDDAAERRPHGSPRRSLRRPRRSRRTTGW